MRQTYLYKISMLAVLSFVSVFLAFPYEVSAHCDTLDGPVIKDARKAIADKDITPVLKWVKPEDEKAVRSAFEKVLAGKAKNTEVSEHKFFETLVKIHRAGEGAPFTGLKPAGTVEPAVSEADIALGSGSSDALLKLMIDDIAAGVKTRYEHAAATFKHKDESVAQGREFVKAYIAFTHYVERIHQEATSKGSHGELEGHGEHE
jgi:hypothetical protein